MVVRDRQVTGYEGERTAETYLTDQGYYVLERNFRFGRKGEIDLIVNKDNYIIFVEVKSRSSNKFGGSLYAITNKKKNTIKKVAQYFLLQNPLYNSKRFICRFDLIAVEGDEIKWIEDIFR